MSTEQQTQLNALEVARAKMDAQIDVYAPRDPGLRESAIEAMRALVVEFEAAVREDEATKWEAALASANATNNQE